MKSVMKVMKKKTKTTSVKRPAASTTSAKGGKGTIAETVKQLKDGVAEDKDETMEESPDELKRDKGKAEKFKAMRISSRRTSYTCTMKLQTARAAPEASGPS